MLWCGDFKVENGLWFLVFGEGGAEDDIEPAALLICDLDVNNRDRLAESECFLQRRWVEHWTGLEERWDVNLVAENTNCCCSSVTCPFNRLYAARGYIRCAVCRLAGILWSWTFL